MRITRREWVKVTSGGLISLCAGSMQGSPRQRSAQEAFDHILLGCADLDVGIRWIEDRTGARAKFGGNHPGRGSRNALLSLGPSHYLEIIAPDPAQPNAPDERGLKNLTTPRIIQWAVSTTDIADTQRTANAAGIKTMGPQPGSRARPDGSMLRWLTLGIVSADSLVPFFIQWESGTQHPSADAPALGTVASLEFETPEPDSLLRLLKSIAINANVRQDHERRIVLTVVTRSGETVKLT
jgi:hypothetical protein